MAWFALEEYDDHTFFYCDEVPDSETLRRLLSVRSDEAGIPKFRALLETQCETLETIDSAVLFEIPDASLPQFTPKPRANSGFFYSPIDDAIAAGINGVPRAK